MTRTAAQRADGEDASDDATWNAWVRRYDHTVVVALLAQGARLDRARDVAQAAWARLYERYRAGQLVTLSLPGLAIAQARYLALDDARREARLRIVAEHRADAVRDPAPDAEQTLIGRQELARAHRALRAMGPRAQQVFAAVYERPGLPHAEVARKLGISVQRLRQTLCEIRARLRVALEDDDAT